MAITCKDRYLDYALYEGDVLLAFGRIKDIAAQMGFSPGYLRKMRTKGYTCKYDLIAIEEDNDGMD